MGQPAVSMKSLHRWLDDKVDASSEAIADLWLKGYSQIAICKQLGISRKRLRTCLDNARTFWLERKNIAMVDMVAEQLRRIDILETQAWEGYERSQKDAVENSVERGKDGTKRKTVTKPQSGDARFLKTVHDCIDLRCKLLGIYKPPEERTEMQVWGVLVEVNTPEQANTIMEYSEFQGKVVEAQEVTEVQSIVTNPPLLEPPAPVPAPEVSFDELLKEV